MATADDHTERADSFPHRPDHRAAVNISNREKAKIALVPPTSMTAGLLSFAV